MRHVLLPALAAIALMAGCSGQAEGDGKSGDLSQVDTVTKVVKITEANDPNDLLGRPNGYTASTVYHDGRAECDEPTAVDCGAKVEVFGSEEAAEARSAMIQAILKDAPILGSEYHYLNGASLLRVTGQLTKSQAAEYEAAFTE